MQETLDFENKIGEPNSDELERFRREIKNIFEAELSKELPTGHFTSLDDEPVSFDSSELGPKELEIWQEFQACQLGLKPISDCVSDFQAYHEDILQKDNAGLAVTGLVSYVGNKLTSMWGQYQLDQKKKSSFN